MLNDNENVEKKYLQDSQKKICNDIRYSKSINDILYLCNKHFCKPEKTIYEEIKGNDFVLNDQNLIFLIKHKLFNNPVTYSAFDKVVEIVLELPNVESNEEIEIILAKKDLNFEHRIQLFKHKKSLEPIIDLRIFGLEYFAFTKKSSFSILTDFRFKFKNLFFFYSLQISTYKFYDQYDFNIKHSFNSFFNIRCVIGSYDKIFDNINLKRDAIIELFNCVDDFTKINTDYNLGETISDFLYSNLNKSLALEFNDTVNPSIIKKSTKNDEKNFTISNNEKSIAYKTISKEKKLNLFQTKFFFSFKTENENIKDFHDSLCAILKDFFNINFLNNELTFICKKNIDQDNFEKILIGDILKYNDKFEPSYLDYIHIAYKYSDFLYDFILHYLLMQFACDKSENSFRFSFKDEYLKIFNFYFPKDF